jgi:hypothetical protein
MKLLALPVPVLLAVTLPQLDKPMPPETGMAPGTAGSLILGTVFLLLWFLNAIDKLPGGKSADRREQSFTKTDRAQMQKLTDLLAERIGEDGLERYLLQAQQTRETHECMANVARHLESLSRNVKTLSEDMVRRG